MPRPRKKKESSLIASEGNQYDSDLSERSDSVTVRNSLLPYQYRGPCQIPATLCSRIPKLSSTHHTQRLGLGHPVNNLKASHIINSKKETMLNNDWEFRRPTPAYLAHKLKNCDDRSATPVGPSGDSRLHSKMKSLSLYESPNAKHYSAKHKDKRKSASEKGFQLADRKANLFALGKSVSYHVGGEVLDVTPMKVAQAREKSNDPTVVSFCRLFRNLLGWILSLHQTWRKVEDKLSLWADGLPELSMEDIAKELHITTQQLEKLDLYPGLETIFKCVVENTSHINMSNIGRVLALKYLQTGQADRAAKYVSLLNGAYLHSEMVDKHLTFLRRKLENNVDVPDIEFKSKIYWEQIQSTIDFSAKLSSGLPTIQDIVNLESGWNVIQISNVTEIASRFGYGMIGKKQVPSIVLSAFTKQPGCSNVDTLTTFCKSPKVEPGSQMRYGFMEAFEQILDKNLNISEDKAISKRRYWEERAKHNEMMEAIMDAMEDWLQPWIFLLPGTISIQSVLCSIEETISSINQIHSLSSHQKFIIHRIIENYNFIPSFSRSFQILCIVNHLINDSEKSKEISKIIEATGKEIPVNVLRNPTILVLHQDLELLPWDWMKCLRTTNVCRMPSLNSINSAKHISSLIDQNIPRQINPKSCTFVLNPDGTLPQVQERLEQYLLDRKSWIPIIARSPTAAEMQNALETQDIMLYCGHGSGSNFYPEHAVQKLVCKAVPILMGCSSAQPHFTGARLYANSFIHAYIIAGCVSTVGYLWEVTDAECDRITIELLERWVPHPNAKIPSTLTMFDNKSKRPLDKDLLTALRKARLGATQSLTRCAAVCYGLPGVQSS